jgi:ABC exporter DevB family membrane fusion protein
MNRKLQAALWLVGATVGVSLGMYVMNNQRPRPEEVVVGRGRIILRIAGNGRVEGASEEIRVSSKIPGRIRTMTVDQGDRVSKGQILVVLDNDDYRARVETERAALEKAEAHLRLLRSGARPEEREQARAALDEATAVAETARRNYERLSQLFDRGVISLEDLDRADRERKTAEARLEATRQRYQQVLSGSRPEEIAAAEAEVRLARARLAEAEAAYENTFIRSPIEGVVIRRFMRPGESIRFETVGMPILSIADTSALRVRAEIDETDVAWVAIGQQATVTADAYRGEVFTGRVVHVAPSVGRKTLFSDEPAEKRDTEILEILIDLDPPSRPLMIGLRVEVVIEVLHKENVLVVPAGAVFRRDGRSFVMKKTATGWQPHPITVGATDGVNVEVRDGVSDGEIVRRTP